jgi:hypothetical protein
MTIYLHCFESGPCRHEFLSARTMDLKATDDECLQQETCKARPPLATLG